MRAFMSSRKDRLPISESANPDGVIYRAASAAAEREARAILAVTEDESASGCGYVRVADLHQPSTAGLAYAEALAAFVEG